MTPKEWADEITLEIYWPDINTKDVEFIKQTITAAVEEAKTKQASVTAKAERDECLKILQKTYQEWVDGDWAPGEAFESARDRIRARGENK